MLLPSGGNVATVLLVVSTIAEAFQPHVARNLRSLKAARVDSGLESRDGRIFEPRSVIDLKYEDGMNVRSCDMLHFSLTRFKDLEIDDPYYATLRMETKKPTILLEHMADVVSGVACSRSGIQLQFASSLYASRARKSWSIPEFIVVTSNEGCNKNGQRLPYM